MASSSSSSGGAAGRGGGAAPSSPSISIPASSSSGSGSAIDQILAGSGRKTGVYSSRRRTSFGQPGGNGGAGTGLPRSRQRQQQAQSQPNRGQIRGRGVSNRSSSGSAARNAIASTNATARAKSPTAPGPTMVSVNTGSRRARALQQLAARRTKKSISSSGMTNNNIGIHGAIADNMEATPRSTSGSRRVSLGTTPVSSSSASSRRSTAAASLSAGNDNRSNAATPRTDPGWSSGRSTCGALGNGKSGVAVTPANACGTTPTSKSPHDGRYGLASICIPLPPSSSSAAAAGTDGGAAVLGLRVTSRTDRTGRAVTGAGTTSTSTNTSTSTSARTPPSPPLGQLKPVRLVPLHGEGTIDQKYALPFLLGRNVDGDSKDDDGDGNDNYSDNDLSMNEVESICEDVWGRGDRCTVVEHAGLEEGGAIPLSLTTVNVLLWGMDAGILLRRCQVDDVDVGTNDGIGDSCNRRYCLYRPTSVSGGDLFVVPNAGTDVANNEEKISADMDTATGVATTDEGDDQQRIGIAKQVEEEEEEEEEEGMVRKTSSQEAATKHDDGGARPPTSPSPPAAPLRPISLSELSEAYENCIGESGEPSPSDVATDLLPRYLVLEDVVASKASSSLASVYDGIRSEGLLPSKEKVVFEVRDGLAAMDRREGLVRLVSAQVMIRLGLLVHGQDDFLGWYQNSFGREEDDDVLAANSSKKKKKKKKKSKKSSSSRSLSTPIEFFREQITELLSCVQFALPTTQTFANFLKEVVASPFGETLGETVGALFDYFEVEVPDVEAAIDEDHDDANRPDAEAADDMIGLGHSESLQSEAKHRVAFPLLEESLRSEMDDESRKEEKTEEAMDPDSPLFRRGSVDLARKSSNPLLANGKHTYIGSHFSNKLTNMSDLFREVEVPRASSQSNSKKERMAETFAAKDVADPSSRLLKKRPRPSSISSPADGDLQGPSKTDPQQSKKATPRPFAPATKSGFESSSSSGANRYHDNDRHIIKETPMKPSRRSRIFGTGSIVPETPARQPQRHSTHHLVAEVAALAAARNKKPRHR